MLTRLPASTSSSAASAVATTQLAPNLCRELPRAVRLDVFPLADRDLARFHGVSGDIILQLHTWGAWEWEERLIRETLAVMPEGSQEASAHLGQLGIVAQLTQSDAEPTLHRPPPPSGRHPPRDFVPNALRPVRRGTQ